MLLRELLIYRKELSLSSQCQAVSGILTQDFSLWLEFRSCGLELTACLSKGGKWVGLRSTGWLGLVLLWGSVVLGKWHLTHLWGTVGWGHLLVIVWHRHLLRFLLERLGPTAILSLVALVWRMLLLRHHI